MADFSKTDPATVPTVLPMTPTTPMTRTTIFHARSGHGGPPAERLLHADSLVGEAPGCELWLVHRDGEFPAAQGIELVDLSKDTSLRDRHRVAEEIYVGLSGAGRITVDDDAFELPPLAVGSHSPGDGEIVADRQPA
jgi:mannose-6-phosphate isomerase-like protein (cupin superfamily)